MALHPGLNIGHVEAVRPPDANVRELELSSSEQLPQPVSRPQGPIGYGPPIALSTDGPKRMFAFKAPTEERGLRKGAMIAS